MSRRCPGTKRGGGRPRLPRGGPCGYCSQPVPATSRLASYCSDSCACMASRKRRAGDPLVPERGDKCERPPLTEYVRGLLARTGGMYP